ncbi:MAG TPA: DUF5715 family protein [Pyrinomonadaceae bacterium]|nr:DUF5715 family protein [Pyrinomonadaceae bacterium]
MVIALTGGAVWAFFYLKEKRRLAQTQTSPAYINNSTDADAWNRAVEKVKADRGDAGAGALEIPQELKHYEERYWFLATQVAEIEKYRVHTCQDYLDLATLIERGEIVPVPAVTDTYVLFGVGQRADESAFSRYEEDGDNVELYNEAQLAAAYRQLDEKRSTLQNDINSLNAQARKLTKRERTKRSELQKQISTLEQERKSFDEDKARLDQYYKQPGTRQKLFREYESLQTLARNFNGRSYNLDNPSERLALKINMLSSLRPQALKIMEEVAAAYQRQFDRPLPVSSLVRPEQYQRALRRVNRNAVTIDSPPHSTGLAFDIDYRYMSVAEQNFVMSELARIKSQGRIEVIRERNANYHVFAFINGSRPGDDLISASLEKAGAPPVEAHHPSAEPKVVKRKAKTQPRKARRQRRRR